MRNEVIIVFAFLSACLPLFAGNRGEISILPVSWQGEPIRFLVEISGINEEDIPVYADRIYENKQVRISDMQSYPPKKKQVFMLEVPEGGGIENIEQFIQELGWEYVRFNGNLIPVDVLPERYVPAPRPVEQRTIQRP